VRIAPRLSRSTSIIIAEDGHQDATANSQ